MFKVVVDTLGSDREYNTIVLGAKKALDELPELFVTLVGPKDGIENELNKLGVNQDRVDVIDATEVITNDDNPMKALVEKRNSSLVKSLKAVQDDDSYIGMVTGGASGAILMGSYRYLNVDGGRPCLGAFLPAENGGWVFIVDCGATIECTSTELTLFAHLGSDLMRNMYQILAPKVGLLSNGAEENKGNKLVKETYQELKIDKSINFVGNIEGNKALSGDCDVLVCDGFAGNQVLKVAEAMAKRLIKEIMVYGKKNNKEDCIDMAKFFMNKYDLTSRGGAIVLGVKKPIIKVHGDCNETSIVSACQMLVKSASGEKMF